MSEHGSGGREDLDRPPAAAGRPRAALAAPRGSESQVSLHAAILDEGAGAALRASAHRAKDDGRFGVAASDAGVEHLVLGLTPDRPGQVLALTYTLSARPLSAPRFLTGALTPDGAEEIKALGAVATQPAAEQLFHWEDGLRPASARGEALGMFSVLPLDDARAAELRELVAQLKADHLDGLAARARAVGYYREAMALTRQESGQWLFLLYLEIIDAEMRTRLHAYPDDAFTRWWNPRFRALAASRPPAAPSQTILTWSAPPSSGRAVE